MLTFLYYAFAGLGIFFVLFRIHGARLGRKKFLEAQQKEQAGGYADACYTYGVSILNGERVEESKENIARLWKEHGPFHYGDYADSPSHQATLLIIANTLSLKNGPPILSEARS